MKKSQKSRFGISVWQQRYMVLTQDYLMLYHDDREHRQGINDNRTVIPVEDINSACQHYSEAAPIKSKKLSKAEKLDNSRFDIYTKSRVYNLKCSVEEVNGTASLHQSQEWLRLI